MPPRILVYGAGAIGSFIGAVLAESGADVTLLARGAHADALVAQGGLLLQQPGGLDRHVPLRVCRPGEPHGVFDIVFVTLKSTHLAAAAAGMMRAVSAQGALVMVQNGLPWWYFNGIDHPLRGTVLRSLDPDGELGRTIDPKRVIGAVIYRPSDMIAPGVIRVAVTSKQRLVIGEIDGSLSGRCRQVQQLLAAAGFPVEITADIRAAKWQKVLVNLLWNPLAALTQSSPGEISAFEPAHPLIAAVLKEGAGVAASVGVSLPSDPHAELRRSAGNFSPPSMLQDVRSGRPLELDAIVHAAIEIADLNGVPVPTLKALAACAALLDRKIREDGSAVVTRLRG